MRHRPRILRFLASAALLTLAGAGLGGCMTAVSSSADVTGSVASNASRSDTEGRRSVDGAGERYRANPKDARAALQYAQALRASDQKSQAVAVLEQATVANPGNNELLAAYGRALADVGNFQAAFEVLGRAHTPENPDWRILSVQGASLDQLGRHDEARRYYASALKIVPEEPSVLSNLGLSYALSKELPKAESALRRAHDRGSQDPRVRQNLALVIGLQGRFAEAETIAKADLPADEAAANVAYLREMIARKDDGGNAPRAASAASRSRS